MATIRANLKQLRNADVRFISLVDRAATRIPFRVLKRDKEHEMGIDLTSVFKREEPVKPHVSALVVFAQPDEAVGTQVQEAIKAHGFQTDRVQKSDEGETVVYAQGDQPKDVQIVRLSDQTLVSVAGLTVPQGWVGEMVEEHGFFPDLKLASALLHDRLTDIVTKSETPQAEVEAALVSYADYVSQMAMLPANCFALDGAITAIIQKCSCGEADTTADPEAGSETLAVSAEDPEAAKKKVVPEGEVVKAEADPKKKVPVVAPVVKADDAILKALKDIGTTVSGLATKLELVVAEQGNQKKVLDEVTQKADTLNTTLRATVTASPVSEDRPTGAARMRIQKVDEDPRTGAFDTAFLRRRR